MEEIKNHGENNVSFVLQIIQPPGNVIYLNDISSSHTVFMLKTLFVNYVGLAEDRQRLFLGRDIMDNDNRLAFYNVDYHSILRVVGMLVGGARTSGTTGLIRSQPNLFDEVDTDNLEISSYKISDTSEVFFWDSSDENSDSSKDEYL